MELLTKEKELKKQFEKQQVSYEIYKTQYEQLLAFSKKNSISQSDIIRLAIDLFFKEHGTDEK